MSLVATAEACGKDPAAYLTDVLMRIQYHPMSRIDELLPHKWMAPQEASTETAPDG